MKRLVIVKGAGDVASGTIHKLHQSGFNVLALETQTPSAIRRGVSFSEAVFEGEKVVEGVKAILCKNTNEIEGVFKRGHVAVMVDPEATLLNQLKPKILIDAILAKKNMGTTDQQAPVVIALGPGFMTGVDCHAVIETSRGHDLGRIIYNGQTKLNTGIPGQIGGYGVERILRAPASGMIKTHIKIGDQINCDQPVATLVGESLHFTIDGLIRGIIRNHTYVHKGMKIGDIDPRLTEVENCYTISDKARCIAGGVLEAIMKLT